MASRDSTVDIHVRTVGDTSGADKVNASLGILEKSEKQLATARAQFLTATEAEVAEVNRLTEAAKRQQAARDAQAKAEAAAAAQMQQSTKLQTEAMRRLEEAAQRTQRFFAPQVVNPWVTASTGATRATEALGNSQRKAAGSAQSLGTQVLYASRGLQDFQAAGMMGIANNLEQIAMSMGLGAGVAGAATVLGVAVQTMGPHVVTWLKTLNTDGAKLQTLIDGLKRAATAIEGDWSSNKDNATRASDAFVKMLENERKALEDNERAIDANVKMLQQRANVQKTADEQKLAADIEDIKAQKLPADQEKAAIAARKRQALDAKKTLDDRDAAAQISGAADKLTGQAKARDDLQKRVKELEQEKRLSIEMAVLKADQAKLEAKAAETARNARLEQEMFAKAGMEVPEGSAAKMKNDRAQRELEASKARQKEIIRNSPEGRIRGVNEIDGELGQTKADAKAAKEKTDRDAKALQEQVEAERIAKIGRDNTYMREAEKIAREQHGGVYDAGNLGAPPAGLPGSPAPLPPPAAPGSTLPAPMLGQAELNPQRLPILAPGQGFGPNQQAADIKAVEEKFGHLIAALDAAASDARKRGDDAAAKQHSDKAIAALGDGATQQEGLAKQDDAAGRADEAAKKRGFAAEARQEAERRQQQQDGAGVTEQRQRQKLPANSDLTQQPNAASKLPANSDLTKAAQAAAASNAEVNAAVIAHAQQTAQELAQIVKDNKETKRLLAQIQSQMKGMRA